MSEKKPRILVVDDDHAVVDLLVESLGHQYDVLGLVSAPQAREQACNGDWDLLITDVEMPELRGTELLAAVHQHRPALPVLVMAAFGDIQLAVESVRGGASDFIAKPFEIKTLVRAIERALGEQTMRREVVRLRDEADYSPDGLVACSDAMKKVLGVAARAARANANVLITGESGVGKGAVARWIHDHGSRHDARFLQINCAALPANLIESELFGYRKGAYTDARESREGLFVQAGQGTIFLDEIGELPIELQSKLLLVLETARVRAIGSGAEVPIEARVIAATNRQIENAIKSGRFRVDLYYRLNVIPLEIPPLRLRREDIPELVNVFLGLACRSAPRPLAIEESAMRWLCEQDWPGNVRQLANVIERAVALTDHDTIMLADVDIPDRPPADDAVERLLRVAAERHVPLAEFEHAYIKRVVASVEGNMSRAARILKIDRRTLYRKLAGQI